MISAIMPKPYPLWEPCSRVPPSGSMCISSMSGTGTGSSFGVPSRSVIQPGSSSAPTLCASLILLPAIALVAASNRKGASFRAGAAMAMGFVPSRGSAANVGTIFAPDEVIVSPTMSSSAASIAWWPIGPECPALNIATAPMPTSLALPMAILIAFGPRMIAWPPAASITAVVGLSRTIFQSALAFSVPLP